MSDETLLRTMTIQHCPAEIWQICLAGDYDKTREICRAFCMDNARCVTVERASYIYTGGEEAGVMVTFRAYPRFPPAVGELEALALALSHRLMDGLYQNTAMICGPTEHTWIKR